MVSGALALLLAAASPAAQQTFRTASNTIAVEATVVDKAGKPVTDLTAADFQILEDGKVQPVQTIYLVTAPSTSSTKSTSAPGTSSTSSTGAPVAPVGAVRVESRNRVMIFVFDLPHLSADGYKRSRSAVESFLKDALPSDLVGILAGGTMLNNKIDTNKAALLKALETMKGPNQARFNDLRSWPRLIDDAEALAIARGARETIDRVVLRACGERPDECSSRGGDAVIRQQVEAKARQFTSESHRDAELSLAAMATLANGLGRFPGRKQVVVFSDGFLTTELESQLKSVVELAARNNVRFSTVDARGLNRDPRAQEFMSDQPLTTPGDMTPMGLDNNSDAMSSIAIDTGGEYLMNRNDLRPAIDIIAAKTGTFYVLGYAPEKAMDGSYRRIEVKVIRPGLSVFARRGYVATATASSSYAGAGGSGAGAGGSYPGAGGSSAGAGGSAASTSVPAPERPATATERPAAALEPPATALELPATVLELPATVPELPAAPKARPNSDRNVEALTRVTPASADSAAQKLASAGWAAYSKGDVATARESLAKSVTAGETAPWVYYALGFSEYALGRYEPALNAWAVVRSRVPEFMPVYFDLADANISLGRGTDALAVLREAARRWPLEPEAQNALGTTLVRRGALDDAIEVFTTITTSTPADSLGFFNLGRSYHLRYLRLQQNIAASRLGDKSAIGEDDRKRATAAYKRYLSLGGPFEKEAREALAVLDWK